MKNLKVIIVFLIPLTCITLIFARSPTEFYNTKSEEFGNSYEKFIVKNSVNFDLVSGKQDSVIVVFNDTHLEQAVREALAKPTGDIYDTDMATLISFTAEDDSISDLTGLEYAVNLKELDLNYNQIANITSLQGLDSLIQLELSANKINDITPLQDLTRLSYLELISNQISDITVLQNLTNLQYLYLDANPISDFTALQNLTELEKLGIEENLLDNEDLTELYNLDKLTLLYMKKNPGIISGIAVQALADNLDLMNCEDIDWDGTCDIDPSLVVICWIDPSDSAAVGQTVTVQATATDSNQAQVQIKIDWGDGISDYSELKANASTFEFTHCYSVDGYYDIKVIARNEHGMETEWSEPYALTVGEPSMPVKTEMNFMEKFSLCQNYPNPFNPETTIFYQLPKSVKLNISIYNLTGQRIKVLENNFQQAGSHSVRWDGKDENGISLASGIYICRI